jgi:phosphopantothenoylcysteine decarboxylase/phosphopantothenate--cysteine ligase
MGVALAEQALARGAEVTVVHAHLEVPLPRGVVGIAVSTSEEMLSAMMEAQPANEIILMAAAVADWRSVEVSEQKIQKSDGLESWEPRLERARDILQALDGAKRPGQMIVGFAAETDPDPEVRETTARKKLVSKQSDAIVLNLVGDRVGFGEVDTAVTLITASPQSLTFEGTKSSVAGRLLDALPEL